MEVGELHLGTGTTSTDFHKEGKWPSLREALNIAARGSEIIARPQVPIYRVISLVFILQDVYD